ncbi:MAG: glycosyltransferase [Propionibacteriaceae bacterium]|nr:glycosyltransferase [Propionibacteriaceae bacterium]
MQQPHAVIALPNNIEIDARAHRNALALASVGFRVTMVGFGTGIPHTGEISGIPYYLMHRPVAKKKLSVTYRLVRKAFHLTMKRRPPQAALKAVALVDGATGRVKREAVKVIDKARPKPPAVGRPDTWQGMLPFIADMEAAMYDKLVELQPDLIVTDVHLLHLANRVKVRSRNEGRRTAVIYDAREYVYGLASEDPNVLEGFPALESEYIRECDAVLTVCEPIADFLANKYDIPTPPLLPNAPIANLPSIGKPMTIRDFLDVPEDVPLLAYAGGLSVHRGVHDVISALPELPGVHLAIGSRRPSSYTLELDELARKAGVRDRVHFVPFAPTHEVAEYLASATAAIFPFLPVGNHNWAAPNKYFEAVQARLPILTSNMEWLSEKITSFGIGEVFEHSNPSSCAEATRKLLANLDSYKAKLTDELVQAHTFEHFSQNLIDEALRVVGPELQAGLRPHDLTDQLYSIRRDMLGQRARLADSDLFEPRPRLRIGTSNSAGQANEWAGALMRHFPEAIADSVWRMTESISPYPVTEQFNETQAVTRYWQTRMKEKLASRYTHVLSESGRPIAGAALGKYFWQETEWLTQQGIRQGLVFHGSDIRNPRRHAELESHSPFGLPAGSVLDPETGDDLLTPLAEELQKRTEALLPHVKAFDGPVFVTTADLFDYLPEATWLPLTVDTDLWHPTEPPLAHGKPPLVLHIPNKIGLKGSEVIDEVCLELQAQGLIRYVRETGVPHAQVHTLMEQSDIVIDQLRIGDYGVTAIEAMSMGKVVVGHLADRVLARYPEEPPIVRATPTDLREVLTSLIADPERAAEIGERSRRYAVTHHNGERAAQVLAEFMQLERD